MRVSLSTSLSVCLGYLSIYPASCCARSDLVGCVPWFVCGIPLAWFVVVGVPCLYVGGAFGRLSPPLVDALRAAAEWRKNKLTASEYDETTWSARTWMAFVTQRLSVASQLSMAQEAAEALGLSVAADPRAQ